MSIYDMSYRTKTYLAGDWDGDKNLIDKLHEWNDSERLALNFTDVHEFTSSNDNSHNCSIKRSLRQRMNLCKTFVLVVGSKTKSLRSGSCALCGYYKKGLYGINPYCSLSSCNSIDYRSYVDYECDMALKDFNDGKIKNIVVIYNNRLLVDKSLCPDSLKTVGVHIPSDRIGEDGKRYWNYQRIKDAICK